MKSLTLILLILSLHAFAQKSEIFRIDSLPTEGVLLNKGWKFHAGDNPEWAKPDFDDSAWEGIDPTKDIMDLPQIQDGKIGWLRLRIKIDTNLLPQPFGLRVIQTIASEIYVNGHVIKRYGNLNAENSRATYVHNIIGIHQNNTEISIAVRFAFQKLPIYNKYASLDNNFFNATLVSFNTININAYRDFIEYSSVAFISGGIFLILFILHLAFYIYYPPQKANLYFSAMAFCYALHSFMWAIYVVSHAIENIEFLMIMGILRVLIFPFIYIFLLKALYSIFNLKLDYIYWVTFIINISLLFACFFNYKSGVGVLETTIIQLNTLVTIYITIKAFFARIKNTKIILLGMICSIICFGIRAFDFWDIIPDSLLTDVFIPFIATISIPVSISWFLGAEFAVTNKSLVEKLIEVKQLASENYQILATQNETLEQQVTERTSELELKNRELEIETALERIRSSSMAMQQSDELSGVIKVIFEQFQSLGFNIQQAGFTTNIHEMDWDLWLAIPNYVYPNKVILPYFDHPLFTRGREVLANNQDFIADVLSFEETNEWFQHMFKTPFFSKIPEKTKEYLLSIKGMARSAVNTKNIALTIFNYDATPYSPEENLILRRFAQAFEQSYNRFLDLQKAETQAREAQIEVAVERVRTKAMAMYKSEDLLEVVTVVWKEMASLHIANLTAATILLEQENGKIRLLDITQSNFHDNSVHTSWDFEFDLAETDIEVYFKRIWLKKDDYYVVEQNEKQINAFADWLSKFRPEDAEEIKQTVQKHGITHTWHPTVSLEKGKMCIDLMDAPNAETERILMKIGDAFDLAYTRFNDLKKAEAQTREARIEIALERIRSRTMAMQNSDELREAANLLSHEVRGLGIPIWSCGYNILEKGEKSCIGWMSTEGSIQPSFKIPLEVSPTFIRFYESRQKEEVFYEEQIGGADLKKHYDYMLTLPDFYKSHKLFLESGHQLPTFQVNNVVNFTKGNLIFITAQPVPQAWDIFKRFATVFEQTYTRFLDLQNKEEQGQKLIEEKQRLEVTLTELRTTQTQLIQKEKLASLGELTAGIAHEIQNPLNFVNNFSELSVDLVKDLKDEFKKPEKDEAYIDELFDDLSKNQEKINHHGKRASSIVKGMLEHSRASTGVKELTDINKLADEYLRLSYHGMRAKDKDFNATMETHFQDPLSKIEIIPQDIGRVLLNLINNAFYAVNEKNKQHTEGVLYNPTVTVTTQQIHNQIVIKVKDNGTGMPESVRAKVFQPFFTTKPTGQGTGLGLSLAYDIVTKGHGGTLEVVSNDGTSRDNREGVGTEFIVRLIFSQ